MKWLLVMKLWWRSISTPLSVLVAECCLTPTHLNSADNLLPSCYFLTHCTVPAALLLSNSGPKENSVCPPLQVLNRRVDVALRDVVSGDGLMVECDNLGGLNDSMILSYKWSVGVPLCLPGPSTPGVPHVPYNLTAIFTCFKRKNSLEAHDTNLFLDEAHVFNHCN